MRVLAPESVPWKGEISFEEVSTFRAMLGIERPPRCKRDWVLRDTHSEFGKNRRGQFLSDERLSSAEQLVEHARADHREVPGRHQETIRAQHTRPVPEMEPQPGEYPGDTLELWEGAQKSELPFVDSES
jgi:hypothetical protein